MLITFISCVRSDPEKRPRSSWRQSRSIWVPVTVADLRIPWRLNCSAPSHDQQHRRHPVISYQPFQTWSRISAKKAPNLIFFYYFLLCFLVFGFSCRPKKRQNCYQICCLLQFIIMPKWANHYRLVLQLYSISGNRECAETANFFIVDCKNCTK